MRREAALADRNAAVRKAARAWRKAGAIDDAALAGVEAACPDDRVRVGPVFRVLLFVFTLVGLAAAFGFMVMLTSGADAVWPVLFFGGGIALVLLTEAQTGPLRRAQGGTEAATSFAALGLLIGGVAWLVIIKLALPDRTAISQVLLVAVLLCAAAAWRWGYPLYATFATVALLLLFAQLPWGRLLWIAVPLALAPLLLHLGDSRILPPSLRSAATAALITALAGLYFAVNLESVDMGWIELFGAPSLILDSGAAPPAARTAAAAGTALLPILFLALGLRTRRRPLLLLGLATAVASILTLHAYVDLGPEWLLLTLWGAAAVGIALALRRFLDSGPDHERAGFTAEPLFEDLERLRILETGAALVAFSPEARDAGKEPGFTGGGGEFGGGGSSESF